MNELFDIAIIGAGTKGQRIAKKLAKTHKVVVVDPNEFNINGAACVKNEIIYVSYIRGIIGLIQKGNSSPDIFAQRLIITTPTVDYLPKNFYQFDDNNQVVVNTIGQLPAVKPLVYVANKIATGFNSNLEKAITETVTEGLSK